jgi:hypothetical protein
MADRAREQPMNARRLAVRHGIADDGVVVRHGKSSSRRPFSNPMVISGIFAS